MAFGQAKEGTKSRT